jgi:hypothetical protein
MCGRFAHMPMQAPTLRIRPLTRGSAFYIPPTNAFIYICSNIRFKSWFNLQANGWICHLESYFQNAPHFSVKVCGHLASGPKRAFATIQFTLYRFSIEASNAITLGTGTVLGMVTLYDKTKSINRSMKVSKKQNETNAEFSLMSIFSLEKYFISPWPNRTSLAETSPK